MYNKKHMPYVGRHTWLRIWDERQLNLVFQSEGEVYVSEEIACAHDVIDGAPAARFVSRLAELVQDGFGLIR